jgi:hypothetical protein
MLLEELAVDRPRQLHQRTVHVGDRIKPRVQQVVLEAGRSRQHARMIDERLYTKESIDQNYTELILTLRQLARSHEESKLKSDRLSKAWARKRERARDPACPIGSPPG